MVETTLDKLSLAELTKLTGATVRNNISGEEHTLKNWRLTAGGSTMIYYGTGDTEYCSIDLSVFSVVPSHDATNPEYYKRGELEAIEVIDAFFHDNYSLGNVFKYIARAGLKDDRRQDLEKAMWYLKHEIESL